MHLTCYLQNANIVLKPKSPIQPHVPVFSMMLLAPAGAILTFLLPPHVPKQKFLLFLQNDEKTELTVKQKFVKHIPIQFTHIHARHMGYSKISNFKHI